MDGQAQAPEYAGIDTSGGMDALEDFLTDNPDREPEDDLPADESTDSKATPPTDDDADADDDSQEDDADEATKATPEEFEVTVKSEDGSDSTIKVSKDELVKGYQRQSDYTRKTQGLVERENNAVEVFKSKYGELQSEYVRKAEFATQAMIQMAGFRSDAEMDHLAVQDPSVWAQETQRQNQIRKMLGTLVDQTQAERQRSSEEAQNYQDMQTQRQTDKSWTELRKDGVDKQKLQKTYESVMKNYGYEPQDLATVTDYRLVRMMADANAYRELKTKAPAVTQQAKAAPKVQAKQTTSASRATNLRTERFRTGRGSLQDLADSI